MHVRHFTAALSLSRGTLCLHHQIGSNTAIKKDAGDALQGVDLSEMLGNADTSTPSRTSMAEKRTPSGGSAGTPGGGGDAGGGSTEQKLKKMALKLKKENEALKISLAKAEEVSPSSFSHHFSVSAPLFTAHQPFSHCSQWCNTSLAMGEEDFPLHTIHCLYPHHYAHRSFAVPR